MSISTQTLYEDALSEVGGGVGSNQFNRCFINATNCALDELGDEADLATRHTHISSVSATISTLDSDRSYILYAGIIYYLIRKGQRPTDPKVAVVAYQDSERAWERAKANYCAKILNDNQATDSYDVTKFGHLDTQ